MPTPTVTELPLSRLWTDAGQLKARRLRDLRPEEFYTIILEQSVPLVVAEIGRPLCWVTGTAYVRFFWRVALPRIAPPESVRPDDFPDQYCYVASEWSAPTGSSVVLLERYGRGDSPASAGTPEEGISPEIYRPPGLSALERAFCLDLYRYAVQRYQPIIESRTGASLGQVIVKDIVQLRADKMAEIETAIGHGWIGLLKRLTKSDRIAAQRAAVDRSVSQIHPRFGAVYHCNTIYISFLLGTERHETCVARTTVHELAHCLWEKLGGNFDRTREATAGAVVVQDTVVEGYATYAERIWFRDAYPRWLRTRFDYERLDETDLYIRGLRLIQRWVKRWGEGILLEIPTSWPQLLAKDGK